jgi:hypothetical protein
MQLNGAGLIIPNQTANSATPSADYASGMSIILNDNSGSRTSSSGRMHVSEYFKTFFLDVPSATGSTGTYENDVFAMRELRNNGTNDFEYTLLKIDTSTNMHVRGVIQNIDNSNQYLDFNGSTSLQVAGDIVAYYSSDKRLKDNIKPIENALDKVNKISGVTFEWNEESHKETGKKDVGVIAQEIEEILPELVDNRSNGYKAVDYPKLTALLIEAVKDLSNQVKELKNGITK